MTAPRIIIAGLLLCLLLCLLLALALGACQVGPPTAEQKAATKALRDELAAALALVEEVRGA